MADIGQIFQQLFGEYAVLIDTRYSYVAACFVLWYDFSLTFAREVKYFWSTRKWGWVTFLFLANRYIPLVISMVNVVGSVMPHISASFCWFWLIHWYSIGSILQITLIDLVICYRLYLIFHRDKRLLICMSTILLLTTAAQSGILGVIIKDSQSLVSPIPGINVCYADSGKATSIYWTIFLPNVFFESTAFTCALWRTYRQIKEFKDIRRSAENVENELGKSLGQRLIEAMFRDSLLYFFCVLILLLADCLVLRFTIDNQATAGFGEIVTTLSLSTMSIICTHILFHSCENIGEIFHPEANVSTLPSVQFAGRGEVTLSDRETERDGSLQIGQ